MALVTSSPGLKPRLGYFEHLTTLPVTFNIEGLARAATCRRVPLTEVWTSLDDIGDLEVGLLPAPEALKSSRLQIVPSSCVSVLGPSNLFVIASRVFPGEIQSLVVDHDDFGMADLAVALLAQKAMVRPRLERSEVPLDPRSFDFKSDGHDAYLLSGYSALLIRREAFAWTMDISQSWHDLTKLPLVVHVWVVRKNVSLGRVDRELTEVAQRSSYEIPAMARREAEKQGIPTAGLEQFLSRILRTEMGPQEMTSLRRYAKEVAAVQPEFPPLPPNFYQAGTQTRR
jgi:predicted solute-binding protein